MPFSTTFSTTSHRLSPSNGNHDRCHAQPSCRQQLQNPPHSRQILRQLLCTKASGGAEPRARHGSHGSGVIPMEVHHVMGIMVIWGYGDMELLPSSNYQGDMGGA